VELDLKVKGLECSCSVNERVDELEERNAASEECLLRKKG